MRAAVRFVQRLFCVETLSGSLRSPAPPKGGAFCMPASFAVVPETLPPCQGLSLWERWHRIAMTERASSLALWYSLAAELKAVPLGKVAANAVSRRKGHSTAALRFRRKQAPQMQFPAATPRVKRQFWKIRRFSRIANLKIYFPLIMRRATRSAFKIVLCPAGERTQKMLPLAGEQIRHTTPNYAE